MPSLGPILEALGLSGGAVPSGTGILVISLLATFVLGIAGTLLGERMREALVAALKAKWITVVIYAVWAVGATILANEFGRWIPASLAAIPLLVHFLLLRFRRATLQRRLVKRVSVDHALLASMLGIFPAAFAAEQAIIDHRYQAFGKQAVVSLLLPPRIKGATTAMQSAPAAVEAAADAFFAALHIDLRSALEDPPYSSYVFVAPTDARDGLFRQLCEELKNLTLIGAPPARLLVDYSDHSGTPVEIVLTSVIQPMGNRIDELHVTGRLLDRSGMRLDWDDNIDVQVKGEILGDEDERHRVSLVAAYRLARILEGAFNSSSADPADFGPVWRKVGTQIVDFAKLYVGNNRRSQNARIASISADLAAFLEQNPACLAAERDPTCIESLVAILDSSALPAGGEEDHEVARATVGVRITSPESPQ